MRPNYGREDFRIANILLTMDWQMMRLQVESKNEIVYDELRLTCRIEELRQFHSLIRLNNTEKTMTRKAIR